jgi:hypothetical protein
MPKPSISIGPRPSRGPKLPHQFPGKPDDPTKPGKRRPAKGDPAYNPDVTPANPKRPLPQR